MLSQLYKYPARIRTLRNGPCGSLLEQFASHLHQAGYAKFVICVRLRAAEHIIHWATRKGISVNELNESAFEPFRAHLKKCRCGQRLPKYCPRVFPGARMFLRYLQGISGVPTAEPTSTASEPQLLKLFFAWMRSQRGVSDRTLETYRKPLRTLIGHVGENPKKLSANVVRQFVLQQRRLSAPLFRQCTTGLRMFLRFLIAEGKCPAEMLGAIPRIANWRLSSLPRYLPVNDVERMVQSCDHPRFGIRDRAILLLLARLGLRAGDIVQLRLQDIDWANACIFVYGKSRRQARLPLSQEVGQAIVAYLTKARPHTDSDRLFVSNLPPFQPLASHTTVSTLVDRAFRRAKVTRPGRGAAHLLRHSLASSMLREGASLQEISVLLRHRSIDTTQIYAKVDVMGLSEIAQPWPEVRR